MYFRMRQQDAATSTAMGILVRFGRFDLEWNLYGCIFEWEAAIEHHRHNDQVQASRICCDRNGQV